MSEKKVKAIIIGCGMTGADITHHVVNRGVEIVGAIETNENLIGKDVGEVAGIGPIGISLGKDAEAIIKKANADIAIVSTRTVMEDVYPTLKLCLENKLNVITTSEEAYCATRTSPERGKELNELAKKNGVTLYATGIQDVFWSTLPIALTGTCHEIKAIRGYNCALVDDFGPAVADEIFAGKTVEEFNAIMALGEEAPVDAFTIALYTIVNHLGLHTISEKASCVPIIAQNDVYAEKIDRHIKKGCLIGNIATTELDTEEGITIAASFISKLEEAGDTAYNKWEIEGVPIINLITDDMQGPITTASNLINRIPDVINAEPGYKNVIDMPLPFFRAKPFGTYIK